MFDKTGSLKLDVAAIGSRPELAIIAALTYTNGGRFTMTPAVMARIMDKTLTWDFTTSNGRFDLLDTPPSPGESDDKV